ncbi:MAG: sulfurtransferase [Fimbriiglobus sp.]
MMTLPLAVVHLVLAVDPAVARYPRPNLLIEADALHTPAKREAYRILDARPAEKYTEGHVPGAVLAPTAAWSKAVTTGAAGAGFWKREFAAIGVSRTVPVVVYAEDVRDAVRVWWVLKLAGVPDVRVLNGGWPAYLAAGGEGAKEATTATAEPVDWKPTARHASKDDVLAVVKDGPSKTAIVDARSKEEFTGEKKLSAKGGHVPGAVHLEWTEMLDPKTTKFLPPAELSALVASRNIDLGKPCVTYCQGGGRAAVVAFGLELLGADSVKDYFRSWGEWGNDADTPVALPKK